MQHFLKPMWKTLSKLESQSTVVQAWGNLQKFKMPAVPNEPEFLKKVVKRFQSGSTKPQILGKVEESCQLQSEELSAIQRAVAEGDYL